MNTALGLSAFSEYLTAFSTFYPSIDSWCSKVLHELPSGRRTVLALLSATGTLEGLAITKNGPRAKLCHISITEHARGSGGGWALMQAAGAEMLRKGARHIHVTTGEEVADKYGYFFTRSGFTKNTYRSGRYRRGSAEWVWSANYYDLVGRLFGSGSVCVRRIGPTVFRANDDLSWVQVVPMSMNSSSAP
jgi:hypothetical protein